MLEYLSIVAIIGAGFAVYYAMDISEKVKSRFFELKNETQSSIENIESFRKEILEEINSLKSELDRLKRMEGESAEDWRIKSLSEKVSKLDEMLKTKLKELENKSVQTAYELGALNKEVSELKSQIQEIESEVLEGKEELKEKLKEELLREVEEEIEHLEDLIERRKEEEVEEFLELITTAITLQPEKISSGLLEAKRALLSLRDIAKVYVLTGKGKEEFDSLKENLIGLLKNLRKLAVVSVPDESVYSRFRDAIILVKRLNLPMKDERNGKELNPERSFIEIHRLVYKVAGELDSLAEMINEPVPVTPIEKEFYEKLRIQFEELRKLEEQVEMLMARLGGKETVEDAREAEKKPSKKELEELLKELDL
ncbi:hypothetical protein A3L09_06205 [Thermococcus profundus]|uniref:DNA double-strand break repair Rad50 ATPase n=1 Tax=Thermococcus profundus TaxID=49899 RepID=A0A2Z2MBL5_THEPR|nr:hypothetical protein [Thermococcus profundus]ASJ02879.1 hypothetical protein A3L09_06205 [Thermococcus profundus]